MAVPGWAPSDQHPRCCRPCTHVLSCLLPTLHTLGSQMSVQVPPGSLMSSELSEPFPAAANTMSKHSPHPMPEEPMETMDSRGMDREYFAPWEN